MGAGSLLATPAMVSAQGQTNGVALVIGNSKYHWEATLPNVKRDAPDVARVFQSYGLQTELVQDAGLAAMSQALEKFSRAAKGANFAVLYFAGHGVSWEANSYIVPVDADLSNPSALATLIPSGAAGKALGGAANRLLVFDNCRNNPADGWRQVEAQRDAVISPEVQRSELAALPNTLVLFSTPPGQIALDGPAGENSPFAAAFIRQMQGMSVDLQSLPSKLRRDLLIATEGRQVMWDNNSFEQPFVLTAPGNRKTVTVSSGNSVRTADPARIIELSKAFALENRLPLPSGLIGYRPAGKSRDSQKIGSFRYINRNSKGEYPALLVVMSVEEQQSAEVIVSSLGRYSTKTEREKIGLIWRAVTARISGDRLEFTPHQASMPLKFSWRDANSGKFETLTDDSSIASKSNPNRSLASLSFSSALTRLDG